MKLLLINPNTSTFLTERMVDVARGVVRPGTEVVGMTAHRGVPYIANRAEAVIGASAVLELLADLEEPADAAIIAAFGDPGVGAARELMDFPVVGLAEAAMLTACALGKRFSIISFSPALGPWYRECVEICLLADRLASIRLLAEGFSSIASVHEEKEAALLDLARVAVEEDGADVLLFAGAPLTGLAERLRGELQVPVIEGIAAAVMQAEMLATLAPSKARAGSFLRPAPKTSIGLTPALERLLGGGNGHGG